MALVLMGSLNAQRKLKIEGNILTVDKPDDPQNGAVYEYLWWYGDGNYESGFSDTTTHIFYPGNMSRVTGGQYHTSLITTENYGTEGNPDLIIASHIPPLGNTTSNYTKRLDASNPSDFIRLSSFRKAVPDDTVFLIVTYGIPSTGMFVGSQTYEELILSIDFGQYSSKFEYVNKRNWNESFLVNHDIGYLGNNRWELTFDPLAAGEERTILLPFKYSGEEISGSFEYSASLEGKVSNDGGNSTIDFDGSEIGNMTFAESHDPNRTYVREKLTDCLAGGEELEYEVHFENTGKRHTKYVRIEMHLHEAHDLNEIEFIQLPRWFDEIIEHPIYESLTKTDKQAFYSIDEAKNSVVFEFHNLFLPGVGERMNSDPSRRTDFIKFKVKVKDDYVIGEPITAFANIFFDDNKPVLTNMVETTCPDPIDDNDELERIDKKEEDATFLGMGCWCWLVILSLLFVILFLFTLYIRRRRKNDKST